MRSLLLVGASLIALLGVAMMLAVCTAAADPVPGLEPAGVSPRAEPVANERSPEADGGVIGRAIWADATDCDPNSLVLSGSGQTVDSGIHSNGDIHVNGNEDNPSVFTGPVEYVTTVMVQGAIIIDPPDNSPHRVEPDPLALLFDLESYAPGGHRALAAGANYYYFSSEDYPVKVRTADLVARGLLDPDGNLSPGLYFADKEFELTGSLSGAGVTFVTRDSFSLSSSQSFFSSWEPELLIFALSGDPGTCNETAVAVNASDSEWLGLIYAPFARIDMGIIGNASFHGSFVGYTIDLSGSDVSFMYDPLYDPLTRTITFLHPSPGEVLTAANNVSVTVPVSVAVDNFLLPTEGDWRLLVDGDLITESVSTTVEVDLPLGRHLLEAELRFMGGGIAASDSVEVAVVPAHPWIGFEESGYQVEESAGAAEVAVVLEPPLLVTATVAYSTADGTARAGEDYLAASGVLTFAPGITRQLVTVPILDDALHEANEVFSVQLGDASGATITGTNPIAMTILDDDPVPAVAFGAAGYEVDEGAVSLLVTATLDVPSGLTVTVSYATSDGSATAGEDYLAAEGVLTYSPGITVQALAVTMLDDLWDEDDETLLVALSDPVNAVITGTNPVSVAIIDDDPPPVVGFGRGEYSGWEGDAGTITVTLDVPSALTVTVSYSTTDGTAAAEEDYVPAHGTLVFPPATSYQTFTVTLLDDGDYEGDETLHLVLWDPVNADAGLMEATLVVLEDDPPLHYLYLPLLVR